MAPSGIYFKSSSWHLSHVQQPATCWLNDEFFFGQNATKIAVGWFHQVILIPIFHIISHYPMSYYYHPITMQKSYDNAMTNPIKSLHEKQILDHVSIFFRYIPLIFSHIPLLYHWNFHNISFFLMLQPPYFFPLKSHEIPRKNQLIKPSSGISSRYFLAIRSIKIIGKSLLTTPWFSPFHPPNIHKSIPFQPTQITLISLMTQQGLRFRRRLRSPEARLRATWNPEKTRENRKTWWKKAMKTWKFVKKTRTNT